MLCHEFQPTVQYDLQVRHIMICHVSHPTDLSLTIHSRTVQAYQSSARGVNELNTKRGLESGKTRGDDQEKKRQKNAEHDSLWARRSIVKKSPLKMEPPFSKKSFQRTSMTRQSDARRETSYMGLWGRGMWGGFTRVHAWP